MVATIESMADEGIRRMSRLEVRVKCKHGFYDYHNPDPSGDYRSGCNGGPSEPLDPDRVLFKGVDIVIEGQSRVPVRDTKVQDVLDVLEDK